MVSQILPHKELLLITRVGGIKLSKLEHTISGSLESDDASTKIQQVCLVFSVKASA